MELPKNTKAAISYVLGPVTGLVFLFLDKDSYVRFHSLQSVIYSSVLWSLGWTFSLFLPTGFLASLAWLSWFAVSLFMVVQAHSGVKYELPVVGRVTKNILA